MVALERVKRVVQLVFDGEIYSLAWVAAKNRLKRPQAAKATVEQPRQKKAKAIGK